MTNTEAAQVAQPDSSKLAVPMPPPALTTSGDRSPIVDDGEDHYYDMPCTD